ncbi:craniofacial development protein 2 [Elysia marginata]|uniref:Craniofacial development protein 2 n=1 Tax=Elysia marginata TaxID=1093978 RepID=A0AAV4ET88_9GAST|nr:craniofacial development protein 2 [Elysia marginata]
MYETGRTFQIAREMKAYNIGLLGLSETRWLQSGQLGLVSEEEIKDCFYQQLQAELDNKKTNNITILMGDINAKIGADNKGYEEIMGTHGIGQMNENGERFADFCAMNQMFIGGSIFSTQKHPQGDLEISRPHNRKPN